MRFWEGENILCLKIGSAWIKRSLVQSQTLQSPVYIYIYIYIFFFFTYGVPILRHASSASALAFPLGWPVIHQARINIFFYLFTPHKKALFLCRKNTPTPSTQEIISFNGKLENFRKVVFLFLTPYSNSLPKWSKSVHGIWDTGFIFLIISLCRLFTLKLYFFYLRSMLLSLGCEGALK